MHHTPPLEQHCVYMVENMLVSGDSWFASGNIYSGFYSYKSFYSNIFLKALTIFSWVESSQLSIGEYVFPVWTEVVGNLISASSLLGIIGWMFYEIFFKYVIKIKNHIIN